MFCFLKVFSKFIDGSGLDQLFEEAGMYVFNSLWFLVSTS